MYRGIIKNKIEKVFVYGDLINNKEDVYIHPTYNDFLVEHDIARDVILFRVESNSVGRSVGFPDKAQNEMYEGDIIQDERGLYFVIEWNAQAGMFWKYFLDNNYTFGERTDGYPLADEYYVISDYKIVGNLYFSNLSDFIIENEKHIDKKKCLTDIPDKEPDGPAPTEYIDDINPFI